MLVGVYTDDRLQHRGADLVGEGDHADLHETQAELALEQRINRDDQRLHHVVQKMREADRAQYLEASRRRLLGSAWICGDTLVHKPRSSPGTRTNPPARAIVRSSMLGVTRRASGGMSIVLRRGPRGVKISDADHHAKLSDSQLSERGSAPFAGPLVRRLPVAVEHGARDPYRSVPAVRS